MTGRLNAFSPGSLKIHADIDPSNINKNVAVDIPIVGDAAAVLKALIEAWHADETRQHKESLAGWWRQIADWRKLDCLHFSQDPAADAVIKPQYAVQRLNDICRESGRDTFITTEVRHSTRCGRPQYMKFEKPNRWMTSGGLGTMGYGLPAGMGVQIAHPDALVIDVAGEASILMNIQEMGTLAQYRLPR